MLDIEYRNFIEAYKRWASLSYDEENPFNEKNLHRAIAWEAYVALRDKYYAGRDLFLQMVNYPEPQADSIH